MSALLFALWAASSARAGEPSALAALRAAAPAAAEAPAAPGRPRDEPLEISAVVVDGVQIVGEAPFIAATRAAFALIERSRLASEVFAALKRVEEGPCSGVDPSPRLPVFYAGGPTWQADTLWYASAVVHDSRHSQLYAEALKRAPALEPDEIEWEGVTGERKALAYQLSFLRELKASPERLAYVAGLEKDPRYQGAEGVEVVGQRRDGTFHELDCRGRNW